MQGVDREDGGRRRSWRERLKSRVKKRKRKRLPVIASASPLSAKRYDGSRRKTNSFEPVVNQNYEVLPILEGREAMNPSCD
ncbi:hypothetical protein SUGI_0832400 [Cryptomeria japonica]|nr:hypothetical protein SUGI_0832400 [Cryptomeria japonica]